MGLISATVGTDVAELSASAGQRIICVAWNRSGATTFGVTPNAGGATWVNRVVEPTVPTNDEARRSLAVAELAPTGTVAAVTFTAAWNTGDTGALWMVVEEGADYELVGAAVADSDTSTANQLATGSVTSIPAGNHLAVAALASRDGDTGNIVWATTDVEPDLVGGGSVLLDHFGGVGTGGGNAGGAGYLSLAGQPGGSLADQVTLPNSVTRLITVALVVWAQAAGGESHEGSGAACSVTLAPGAGAGTPATAGSGAGCSTTLTPAAGAGSPSVAGAGSPVTMALIPATGAGTPAAAGAGEAVQLVLTPGTGSGTAEQPDQGDGLPVTLTLTPELGSGTPAPAGAGQAAQLVLTPADGAGTPALSGSGLACSLVLTPALGQPQATTGVLTMVAPELASSTLVQPLHPSVTGVPPRVPTAGGVA